MELDRIYNSDCIAGMAGMESGSVDLIVTDPPYLIGYKTHHRPDGHRFKSEILNDKGKEAKKMVSDYIRECYRILKDDSAAYFFTCTKTLEFFRSECAAAGFNVKNLIVWDKGNWTMGDLECQYGQMYEFIVYCNKGNRKINGKRLPDIWRVPRVATPDLVHQNQKPVDLIGLCVLKSSEEGGVVFDGFMGSGTTAISCIRTKRHFIGYELDKGYYDIASRRVMLERAQPELF